MITRGQVFITRVTTDCKRVIMSYGKEKRGCGNPAGHGAAGGGHFPAEPRPVTAEGSGVKLCRGISLRPGTPQLPLTLSALPSPRCCPQERLK